MLHNYIDVNSAVKLCILNFIFQYGDSELYYRIVNMRDAEIHSMQQITAANYNQYTHPQVRSFNLLFGIQQQSPDMKRNQAKIFFLVSDILKRLGIYNRKDPKYA